MDCREELSQWRLQFSGWGKIFPRLDKDTLCENNPKTLVFKFIACYRSNTNKQTSNTIYLLQKLSFIYLRWGAIIDTHKGREIIRCLVDRAEISKEIDIYLKICEYAIFAAEQWLGINMKKVDQDFEIHLKSINEVIYTDSRFFFSPLTPHILNRCIDIKGFRHFQNQIKSLSGLFEKEIKAEMSNKYIIYGIESRQWAYQIMELKRIYHIASAIFASSSASPVLENIYIINIKGYTANYMFTSNFCSALKIKQIKTLEELAKFTKKNSYLMTQYNSFQDYSWIDNSGRNCNESAAELTDPAKYITKDFYLQYLYGIENFPEKNFFSMCVKSVNDNYSKIENEDLVFICFKDAFRTEQAQRSFMQYRLTQLCPIKVSLKCLAETACRFKGKIVIANDWLMQVLPKMRDDTSLKAELTTIANAIISDKIIFYSQLGKTKEDARLNLLNLALKSHNAISIGDPCGCHDIISSLTEYSVFLGHIECFSKLPLNSINSSLDLNYENYLSSRMIFRKYAIHSTMKKNLKDKTNLYGLNSNIIKHNFTVRDESSVFEEFRIIISAICKQI